MTFFNAIFFRHKAVNIVACAILASLSMLLQAAPEQSAPGFERAKAGVFPALVRIYVVVEHPGNGRMLKAQSVGSGAIINPDGYIVTNHHVAGKGSHFIVNLSNQEEVRAELTGTDPLSDVAVLKINKNDIGKLGADLPVAQWGNSDNVKVGDVVFAMGSPGGVSQSITKGIISNTRLIMPKNKPSLNMDGEAVGDLVSWFAHDAVIFGGNSGGPLVDVNGKIIGINEISMANLSGAIPSNMARYCVEQILKHGEVPRSWLGFTLQPKLKSRKSERGALISSVLAGSPADKAGLRSGDLITHFDGKAVNAEIPEDMPAINEMMFNSKIGKKLLIRFVRNGELKKTSLKTVSRTRKKLPQRELAAWGMTAGNVSFSDSLHLGRDSQNGVLVSSVRVGGPAFKSKPSLQAKDIITSVSGHPINDISDLIAQTRRLKEKGDVTPALIGFERGEKKLLAVVNVGKRHRDPPAQSVRKGWLPVSVQPVAGELSKMIGLNGASGVRVTSIDSNSFSGLKQGDIVTAINGSDVVVDISSQGQEFFNMLRKYPPGKNLDFDIVRNGTASTTSVVLGKAPKPKAEKAIYEDDVFLMSSMDFQDASDNSVVRVEDVISGGWASINGIQVGDIVLGVDGSTVADVDSFEQQMTKIAAEKPRYVVFKIKRGLHEKFIEIEPHW